MSYFLTEVIGDLNRGNLKIWYNTVIDVENKFNIKNLYAIDISDTEIQLPITFVTGKWEWKFCEIMFKSFF